MNNFRLKKSISLFSILIFFILSADAYSSRSSTTEKIRRATIKIITTYIRPDYSNPWKMITPASRIGSGVIISDSHILTNAHVVSDATFIQVQKENEPEKYEAEVSFIGHECDLAVLAVKDRNFFANTDKLELGGMPDIRSKVTTYGYPEGGERISITEGVVSRIEIGTYGHSREASFLLIQTDAALNPGNSGGPVILNGKIVGIAFQANRDADNIGYMIPVPVIEHFIIDISDGRFDGFPSIGVFVDFLENKGYREFLGMKENQSGVLVTHEIQDASAYGYLKKGDVITSIDDVPIANDGSILTAAGRLIFTFLIDLKQVGETIKVKIIRDRQEKEVSFPLKKFPVTIKWYDEYEEMPEYYIFGGIIFQPLSKEYFKTWKNWWYTADKRMLYYYFYHLTDNLHKERKEFVIINHILPDAANTYISTYKDKVVSEINGIKILSLKDVERAFKKPGPIFHVIRIDGNNAPILLKVSEMDAANRRIMLKYNIRELKKY